MLRREAGRATGGGAGTSATTAGFTLAGCGRMRAGLVRTGREGVEREGAGAGATHGMAADAAFLRPGWETVCSRSGACTALRAVARLDLRVPVVLVAGAGAGADACFTFLAARCCAAFLADLGEAAAEAFLRDFAGRTGEPLAEIAMSAASTRTMRALRFIGGARGDTGAIPV